jgi:hypothetical protein
MKHVDLQNMPLADQPARRPWIEPAIAFERSLMAEAQGGPGPHGAPSGLLGPLASSGTTGPSTCT